MFFALFITLVYRSTYIYLILCSLMSGVWIKTIFLQYVHFYESCEQLNQIGCTIYISCSSNEAFKS